MPNDETSYRLRPSVSIIPTHKNDIWEFFQSNTRRIKHIKLANIELTNAILNLNCQTIDELSLKYNTDDRLNCLINYLYDSCFIEDAVIGDEINKHPFNRVINFLADYFPTKQLLDRFCTVKNSTVLIIGLGAIGSWVAQLLAQCGVEKFILCDPDVVKIDNLNRSLFTYDDIDNKKINAVARHLVNINSNISIVNHDILIDCQASIDTIISSYGAKINLVINSSDFPNVDTTSKLISFSCMKYNIPHIIAGGYNLHLSLIGPTIIPYKSPCFNCIQIGLLQGQPDSLVDVKKLYRPNRNIGNCSPLAGISASFAANEAIRVLSDSDLMSPIMLGRRGEFNFMTSQLNFAYFPHQKDCDWCGDSHSAI